MSIGRYNFSSVFFALLLSRMIAGRLLRGSHGRELSTRFSVERLPWRSQGSSGGFAVKSLLLSALMIFITTLRGVKVPSSSKPYRSCYSPSLLPQLYLRFHLGIRIFPSPSLVFFSHLSAAVMAELRPPPPRFILGNPRFVYQSLYHDTQSSPNALNRVKKTCSKSIVTFATHHSRSAALHVSLFVYS